ncbi:hypothetical protein M0805_004650 [Coniferiporia weirii]|nr:hypothetical protein M0805_004650 [Coniferiporia weirii]
MMSCANKTLKNVARRRRSRVLRPVANDTDRKLAHLHSLKRKNAQSKPLSGSDGNDATTVKAHVPFRLIPALLRPALSEVAPTALVNAGLDPMLAKMAPADVRKYLKEIGSHLYRASQTCSSEPILASRGEDLPKYVPVRVAPDTDPAYYPTHMLAVHSSQQVSGKRKVTLFPVHALVLAAHCFRMPRLPATGAGSGAPKSDVPNMIYVPLVPFAIPSPETFGIIGQYLYTGHAELLVHGLMPQWRMTDFTGCVTPVQMLERLSKHLASTCTPHELLVRLRGVHAVWQNACSLGIVDGELWGLVSSAWKGYTTTLGSIQA